MPQSSVMSISVCNCFGPRLARHAGKAAHGCHSWRVHSEWLSGSYSAAMQISQMCAPCRALSLRRGSLPH